jgi:predicted MPP superfamily phosphohydrolase
MISRRTFFRLLGSAVALGAASSAYGVIIEPFFRLHVKRYVLTPPGWPKELSLRVAIVTDLHACDPWMTERHIANIVGLANDSGADVILLLGDYIATHRFQRPLTPSLWANELAKLKAPLGVHAVLGNHDWWNDQRAMLRGQGFPAAGLALQDAGVPVYQNQSVRLVKDGRAFWLAGLGDQIAFIPQRGRRHPKYGIDDLPATLAQVTDDAPVLLLAHEPDIFPQVPARVSLTLSGHTHGGQISLFGWTPVVPSRYGSRYVYGHKVEDGRHIIISSGLGCSGVPVRIGAAPEVVVIDLGGPATS